MVQLTGEDLHKNEYYLFYQLMVLALQTDDVLHGVTEAFAFLKKFLNLGHVTLYKKGNEGIYINTINDGSVNNSNVIISSIVNKEASFVENKNFFNLDFNISEDITNLMMIYLKSNEFEYILTITNSDNVKDFSNYFYIKLKEAMLIILKRAEMYEKNMKAINIDLLTDLDNRNSYEKTISRIDNDKNGLVYAIFDLFRLKYVNDNYGHQYGDMYIKEVANILKKYWPKQNVVNNYDGTTELIKTGHCIYRVGGDEFVLITNKEKLDFTKLKTVWAAEEVAKIDLGLDLGFPLGLNYGIASCDDIIFKEAIAEAEQYLKENKTEMYKSYHLDRRK